MKNYNGKKILTDAASHSDSEEKRKVMMEMLACCLSELAGDKEKTVQIGFVLKSLSCDLKTWNP